MSYQPFRPLSDAQVVALDRILGGANTIDLLTRQHGVTVATVNALYRRGTISRNPVGTGNERHNVYLVTTHGQREFRAAAEALYA